MRIAVFLTNWKRVPWFVGLLPVAALLWFMAFEPAYYSQLAMPMKVHLDRPEGATQGQRI